MSHSTGTTDEPVLDPQGTSASPLTCPVTLIYSTVCAFQIHTVLPGTEVAINTSILAVDVQHI